MQSIKRASSKDGCLLNEHPPSFYCPISQQCMHDPVVLCDGHSYERRHIERWLHDHDTSPVSGLHLRQRCAFPNHALRNAIEEYFQTVFKSHRRAIRKSIKSKKSFSTNGDLLETMDGLVQCSLLVNADLSAESALRCIMDEAKVLVGAEVASVFLVDHLKKQLYSTVNSTGAELRIPISSGIAGHVALTGESVLVEDAYEDDRFDKSVDNKTGFRTRTIICVPIKTQTGSILGVAQLINRTGKGVLSNFNTRDGCNMEKDSHVFSMEDLHFLRVFASQAATAIENDASFETASSESDTDSQAKAKSPAPSLPAISPKGTALAHLGECIGFCLPRIPSPSPSNKRSVSKRRPSLEKNKLRSKSSPNTLRLPSELALAEKKEVENKQGVEQPCSRSAKHCSPHEKTNEESIQSSQSRTMDQLLEDAFENWQMDAWAINRASGNKPLSTLGSYLFQRHGLIEHFDIDKDCLANFLVEIEQGYDDGESVPYHNRVHATSVVHLTHMLLTQGGVAAAVNAKGSCGKLEVMACLLAAIIHDHNHRGLNNGFLVKSSDEWALQYNDQHVNEHHHVASAFRVLRRPECNFLAHLASDVYCNFRSLVIKLVLGTDMAQDKKIVTSFTQLLELGEQSSGEVAFAPSTEEDVLVTFQMALKCADVGHLTLKWSEHLHWVERLEAEFFAQGDKEKKLNLQPSFLMDREKPGVTKTQIGFFDYVALPLYQTLAKAFPSSSPMLLEVKANYQRWCDLETASKAKC